MWLYNGFSGFSFYVGRGFGVYSFFWGRGYFFFKRRNLDLGVFFVFVRGEGFWFGF